MPQRRPTKITNLGPYDLSTRKLPGGTEMEALGTGFALERARDEGYTNAAAAANQSLLNDTTNAYLVADLNSPRGMIARAMTKNDLFNEYRGELTIKMPRTSVGNLHHDIRKAMGIPRGQKVADGLPFQHTLSLRNDTLFVTHVAAAQAAQTAMARALKAP